MFSGARASRRSIRLLQGRPGDHRAYEREQATDAPSQARLPERLLFLTMFLVLPGVYRFWAADDAAGMGVLEALWASLYLAAFVGVIAERKKALRILRASLPLVGIVFLAGLSGLW